MSEMRKLYVEVKESAAKMGREPPAEEFSKSLQTDLCDTFRDVSSPTVTTVKHSQRAKTSC